jgi:hypothetical protein
MSCKSYLAPFYTVVILVASICFSDFETPGLSRGFADHPFTLRLLPGLQENNGELHSYDKTSNRPHSRGERLHKY